MRCTLPTKRGLSLNLSLFCLFGLTMVLSTCGTPSTRTAASALPTPRPDPSPSVHATCRTERLRLALDQDVSELGNAGLQLTFENASRESCTLSGYPALQLLDAQHKQLPMKMARSTSGYLYQMHDPQVITLQPGKKAYFVISWANQGCSSETYHVRTRFLACLSRMAKWFLSHRTALQETAFQPDVLAVHFPNHEIQAARDRNEHRSSCIHAGASAIFADCQAGLNKYTNTDIASRAPESSSSSELERRRLKILRRMDLPTAPAPARTRASPTCWTCASG